MSMPASDQQRVRVLQFFDAVGRWMEPAVSTLTPETGEALAKARTVFEKMIDELPYVDRPQHTMAGSMFACAAMLAVFEVLREDDVDAHTWGRAIQTLPSNVPPSADGADERSEADALASQSSSAPNEFTFEMVAGESGHDRGMNISSCAICHLFARHDAMALVPYMCAFDDVVSTAGDQGLRRTGTIALGADHCDFRFRQGGEPLPLAEQYPDQIRLSQT
jgi:hypothetical protein